MVPRGHVIPLEASPRNLIFLFLFLFCSVGLFGLLWTTVKRATPYGFRICSDVPVMSYSFFVHDIVIFCRDDLGHATIMKDILNNYAIASG